MKAANKNREWLPAMEVAAQKLDVVIDFASPRSKISKDLKQDLRKLRKSLLATKPDHDSGLISSTKTQDVSAFSK